VLRRTGFLDEAHDVLILESSELKKIVATIIRRSAAP
jgi:hypothetical protein